MARILFILFMCGLFVAFKPANETSGKTFDLSLKKIMQPDKVNAFGAVNTNSGAGSGTTTYDLTVTSTAANNLVVVSMELINTMAVTSVTDDKGNAYVLSSAYSTTSRRLYQAYGVQVTGGVTTITVTKDNTLFIRVIADEFSGFTGGGTINNAGVYDTRTTGTGTGTAVSVSTLTPAATGELIVSSMINDGSGALWTAGAGYTLYGTSSSNLMQTQYKLSSASSETAPATLSGSTNWYNVATAFKVPPAAATNTNGFFLFFKP